MHLLSKSSLSRLFIISVLSLVLAACFGEGDGSSSGGPGVATGKLVFSDVAGVTFKSATQKGITGPDSVFKCLRGETVKFAIGDIDNGIILGSAPCKPLVTAVQLTGSSDPSEQPAANLIRFMVSLDNDNFHSNGIMITEAVSGLADTLGFELNFSLGEGEFEALLIPAILHLSPGRGTTPVPQDLALTSYCSETFLPGGGSKAFGFTFAGCSEMVPEELVLNGNFDEVGFTFINDVEFPFANNTDGSGQGQLPDDWDEVINFPRECIGGGCDGGGIPGPGALSGSNSMLLTGPTYFNKNFPEPEVTGIIQDFVPVGGETYTASVMANNFNDSLISKNFLLVSLIFSEDGNFQDGSGEYAFEVEAAGAVDPKRDRVILPPDEWTKVEVTGTTTQQTVAARIQILHLQFPGVSSHSENPNTIPDELVSGVYIDDVSVFGPTVAEAPLEYVEVWRDDFDNDWDFNWTAELGYGDNGWGNQEWQNYTADSRNVFVEDVSGNNILKIKAYCDYLESDGKPNDPVQKLVNESFETPNAIAGELPGACNDPVFLSPWETGGCNFVHNINFFPPPFPTAPSFPETPGPRDGTLQTLKQYGDNASAYQEVTDVKGGQVVTASVYAMSWEGYTSVSGPAQEPFDNAAEMLLTFYDGTGGVLGVTSYPVTPVDLPPKQGFSSEDWTQLEIMLIAPENAEKASIELLHTLNGGSPTAPIWWEGASLEVSDPVCTPGTVNNGRNGHITSARITTKDTAMDGLNAIQYGKIEASIKVPVDRGAWPAFWLLGSNISGPGAIPWPRVGEIDIMEVYTVLGSTEFQTHATLHWCDETNPDYIANTDNPKTCFTGFRQGGHTAKGDSAVLPGMPSLGDDFHVYSVEWNPDRFLFKIDDVEVYRRKITPEMEEFIDRDFFMILNLAMGGNLGSNGAPPSDSGNNWDLPQTMEVDWVSISEQIL